MATEDKIVIPEELMARQYSQYELDCPPGMINPGMIIAWIAEMKIDVTFGSDGMLRIVGRYEDH